MKIQQLMDMGGWVPIHRGLANALGNDAARVFSELCNVKESYADRLDDGWFYLTIAKLGERTGLKRRPIERSLELLSDAGLVLVTTRGAGNYTHYKLTENPDDFGQIGQTEKRKKNVQKSQSVCPKKPISLSKLDNQNVQNEQSECPKEPNYNLNNNSIPLILDNNSKNEIENVARKKTDDETGLTVAPQKQKKTISKKEKSRGLTSFHDAAGRLIDHLNAVAGCRFRHVTVNLDAFARVLHAAEGTEEEIRWVIEFKTMQWKDKPDMSHNLNPQTLCRALNFPRYLEQMHSARHQVQQGTYGKTQQEIATEQAFYQGAINFVPPHLRKY
jgi:uncharacterized phage protein (TIGR02220 family)